MKSSKYTQATSPTDFDLRDYANMPTILTDDVDFCGNRTPYMENSCAASKEYLLKTSFQNVGHKCDERTAGKHDNIEMVCNCALLKDAVYFPKTRCKDHYTSEQDILVANRSFGTLPRFENASQLSLDRKSLKCSTNNRQRKHTYVCEQNQKILQRLDRNHSIKRIQSPEIINIHRANNVLYDAYGPENCPMKLHKGDDNGFARERDFARTAERSV